MFMGPLDKSKPWSTKGLQGCYRFTQKIWKLYTETDKMSDKTPSKETLRILHQSIKKVTKDLDSLDFNTAVSQMMIFVNHMLMQQHYNYDVLHKLLIILNPFAPHITEELNEINYQDNYVPISEKNWPEFDETLIASDSVTIAVQINGKTRGTIDTKVGAKEDLIFDKIINSPKYEKYINSKKIIKNIYIPNKIFNIVVK